MIQLQNIIFNPALSSVIFWCFPLVGIFVLVIAIKLVRGSFYGELTATIPFTQKESQFAIVQPGIYAVWQRGPLLTKTRIAEFELNIREQVSGMAVPLSTSLFAPHVNSFDSARVEWKRFEAQPGNYILSIMEKSATSALEKLLSSILPFKKVKPEDYYLEIHQAQPVYKFFLSIPLFTLAALLIFSGPALALNAKDVTTYLNSELLKH